MRFGLFCECNYVHGMQSNWWVECHNINFYAVAVISRSRMANRISSMEILTHKLSLTRIDKAESKFCESHLVEFTVIFVNRHKPYISTSR